MVKIGVNFPLLKETIARDGVYRALVMAREIGFQYFELSQFELTPSNVEELLRAERELGIHITALSVDVEPLPDMLGGNPRLNIRDNYDEIIEICKRLHCRHCRTFLYGSSEFGTRKGIEEYAKKFDAAAARLAEAGLDYSYHGHNFEFARHDGKLGLRIMRDITQTMKFEICSYWVQAGGCDTGKILREFGSDGRVSICHLKDYRIAPLTDEFLAAHYTRENPRGILTDVVQFAEAGEGNLDIPDIITACDEIGAEYIYLEQDFLYGRSEKEVLQTDYDNLCAMGYHDRM